MPTSRFYVLVGIPGSGKSTYAREAFPSAVRISLDDLRLMFSGAAYDKRYEPMVAVAADALLEALLARANAWSYDVVFDATNVTRARRLEAVERARRHGVEPHCVFFDAPVALARAWNRGRKAAVPEDVLLRFADQLEPPNESEGFVTIEVIRR